MHFLNTPDKIGIGIRISVMQWGPFIATPLESQSQHDDFSVDTWKESEQTVPKDTTLKRR